MTAWSLADLPDQSGRTAVVTGPSKGGLGFHVALELARRGARVVLAGRTPARLDEARAAILEEVPGATLEQLVVDVSLLASVRDAADRAVELGPLHLLVNNAGVMATPAARTAEGLELQLATNHWGPFLLTGLLLPQLSASGAGRVVAVSSWVHRLARQAPLHNPWQPGGPRSPWSVYAQTKVANLLFTFELDRRLREAGLPVSATAAHPGAAGTHLMANGQFGRPGGGVASILDASVKAVSQSAADGALPLLMATTPAVPGSSYCGPSGFQELRGAPRLVGCSALARDPEAQGALWELSERTVGLRYP